ncbi:MAG TPA: gliding motility-associated C-terminal domain-containing protein, partial [Saprospiraceae bacterium]
LAISAVNDLCLFPDVENVNFEVTVTNGNGSGVWSGPGITDPIAGTFNPHMAGVGSHTIMYQYTEEDCDFVETTMIQVFDAPKAIISNTQLIITCASSSILLDGSNSSGDLLIYRWTTTDGDIAGGAETNIAEVIKPGTYQLLIENSVTGCSDSISVTVDQDSAIPVADAGPDKIILCDSLQVTLGGNSTTGNSIVYTWSTMNGNISGGINALTTVVDQPGTYTISVKDTVTECQSFDEVLVEKYNRIEGLVIDQKNISCFGANDASISIVGVVGGTSEYTYDWSVHANGSTTISSLSAGDYSVTVTDANECSIVMQFEISEPDLIAIDLGPDKIVQEGDPVRIELTTNLSGNTIGSIHWSNYDGINCNGCTVFDFVAVSDAIISAIISDTAGCIASDSMTLRVIIPHDRYAPNIFSPNDDGINDYFTIYGRSNLTNITSLRIFDRWGNQVFEKYDLAPGIPQSGWDGKFNGEFVQSGVYLFMSELMYEDIPETFVGSITLIR